MNLTLVRHGETEDNQEQILQGHRNTRLNATGKIQSEQVAKKLDNQLFDIAYVSDLSRARETADYILKYHKNTTVIHSTDLRERSFGIFDGQPLKLYEKALLTSKLDIFTFEPPQGESIKSLYTRVESFFSGILKSHKSKNILIIGHRDWLTMFLILSKKLTLTYENYIRQMPSNTAVSRMTFSENKIDFLLFNATDHLE